MKYFCFEYASVKNLPKVIQIFYDMINFYFQVLGSFHCVKCVQIHFSGPYFPAFGLNTEYLHFPIPFTFRTTNISYPLIHTRTCAYQGARNVRFSEDFFQTLIQAISKGLLTAQKAFPFSVEKFVILSPLSGSCPSKLLCEMLYKVRL